MANSKRTYPHASLRKIVKAHSNKNIAQNVDAMIYLDYIIFIQRLMKHATHKAKESGEKKLLARDIRKVTMKTLREFKA